MNLKVTYNQRIFLLTTIIALVLVFIFFPKARFKSIYRENDGNFFQEIKILKDKNEDLKKEVSGLEESLGQIADQDKALSAIQDEIEKYKKLSGDSQIFGPGFTLILNRDVALSWLVDLKNKFFEYGAQAVSINGIRLTNKTSGIDSLPKGQIIINGSIIAAPYEFNVICDPEPILDILDAPSEIFDKLSAAYPDLNLKTSKKEMIYMQ
ncbi:MAG: DUF881 domain-containing protein [Candidatus Gracilibacteria bacterium]|jgi:uncharacterized protein YlxW (UPF0749 family)